MLSNKSMIYKSYTPMPVMPVPGEHLAVEDRPFDPEKAPPPGGITIKNSHLSLDPYMRGQMRAPGDAGSYSLPWVEGQPAVVTTLATVLKSDTPTFKPGDRFYGMADAAEYAALPAEMMPTSRVMELPPGIDIKPETLVGALGIAGLAAYVSFYEFVKEPRAGKTFWVSAASGASGQIVGQIAKLEGMKVIGSTGSDEKVDFVVKELGFDGAWNYKTERTADALTRLAPEGIDVYYDAVGGEQLETALTRMKDYGQIIASGMIATYHQPWAIRTALHIVYKRLSVNGFICSDPHMLEKYMPTFPKDMVTWLVQGKVKTKEEVVKGIESAPEAMVRMWTGDKFGKLVIEV